VNRYRRFLSAGELALFKPRFQLDVAGGLTLLPNPFPDREALQSLLENPRSVLAAAPGDWFFEPAVWQNPLFDRVAAVRLLAEVTSRVWRARLRPNRLYRDGKMNVDSEAFRVLVKLIARFQDRVEESGNRFLLLIFPGRDTDIWGKGVPAYAPLVEALPNTWIVELGPQMADDPALAREGARAPGGHLTAAANRAIARALAQELERADIIPIRPNAGRKMVRAVASADP
jgi:hypothetical protein